MGCKLDFIKVIDAFCFFLFDRFGRWSVDRNINIITYLHTRSSRQQGLEWTEIKTIISN